MKKLNEAEQLKMLSESIAKIEEGPRPKRTAPRGEFYIMNASSATGKRKSSIDDIIDFAGTDLTILAVSRNAGGKEVKIFISGSGDTGYGKQPGDSSSYVIDTGNGLKNGGSIDIENIITVSKDGQIDHGNGVGMDERRGFWVMK